MHFICPRLYYSKLLESVQQSSSFSPEKFGKVSRMISLKMFRKVESLVRDQVDQSTDLHSLARLLPHLGIDVQDIQHFMKQKIKELNSASAKRAAFNLLPIQAILPMDSMQHILSFQHYSRLKVVNKTFKKCYDRNQDIAKRCRQRIVDEHAHHFVPDITYDKSTNQTYVVLPDGDDISEGALSFGNVIPWTDNLRQLIHEDTNSGDRILVQNGNYVIPQMIVCVDKMLQIIGVGDSVNIKFEGLCGLAMSLGSQVLLRNVNLSFDGPSFYGLIVASDAAVWMENCTLTSPNSDKRITSIYASNRGIASVKHCTFIGHTVGLRVDGLQFNNDYPNAKFPNILGCTFTGCCHTIHSNMPMRCIGNLFVDNEDNVTSPLREEDSSQVEHNDQSVYIGNVFEGSNKEFDWLNWE